MQWYWKKIGQSGLKKQHIHQTVKYSAYLMIWGCIAWQGPGIACEVIGKMDSDQYCGILNEYLKGTIKHFKFSSERVLFQQDNDLKHTKLKKDN